MAEEEPKSAFEIAMERLRKKDADAGVSEQQLTDSQRQQIAEVRKICDAKLAEIEILLKGKLAAVADEESLRALDAARKRDIQHATDERDRKIAKIRAGK
jgi:hypothetical protein